MKQLSLIAIFLLLLPVTAFSLTLSVVPSETTIEIGDALQVDLIAELTTGESLLSWGLDFSFSPSILSMTTDPVVNAALWNPSSTGAPDGDGLNGFFNLSGMMPAGSPSGSDFLLASLFFIAIDDGTSDLIAGYDQYPFEGFFAGFGGQINQIDFQTSSLTVNPSGGAPVPEPATFLLLGTGLAGVLGFRRIRNFRANCG